MAIEKLQVILEMLSGQYKKEAASVADVTGRVASDAEDATTATGKLGGSFGKMGGAIKALAATAAVGATIKFLKDINESSVALAESINATEKVFGSAADQIAEFGKKASTAAGLSHREFNELATMTGSLLTNMGFALSDAATESTNLTLRAADMASVFNVEVGEALMAINAGLRGETEPLRRFGVQLSDTAIRAKAVEMGLAKTTASVDSHGKGLAAVQLIYDQTAKLQGDFADTADQQANATRIMAAEWENFKAKLGEGTVPIMTNVVRSMTYMIGVTEDFIGLLSGDTSGMRLDEAFRNIEDAAAEGGDTFTALADSILHVAKTSDLTAGHVTALASVAGLTTDQFADFRNIILEQAEGMQVFEASTYDLTAAVFGMNAGLQTGPEILAELEAALDEVVVSAAEEAEAAALVVKMNKILEQSTLEVVDPMRELYQSQLDLTSAMLAAVSPIAAADQAMQRLRKAQEKLLEAQSDSKTSAQDMARAQLDVATATLEAEAALKRMGAGDLEAGLDAIAKSLGTGKTEARQLLEALGLLDGKKVAAVVTTSFMSDDYYARKFGGARALGGPVTAGMSYRVGEGGPETFVPHTSGTIVPHNSSNVTVNVTAPVTDPVGLVDSVVWRLRMAGV